MGASQGHRQPADWWLKPGGGKISVKGQTVNILGYLSHMISVTITQLCPAAQKQNNTRKMGSGWLFALAVKMPMFYVRSLGLVPGSALTPLSANPVFGRRRWWLKWWGSRHPRGRPELSSWLLCLAPGLALGPLWVLGEWIIKMSISDENKNKKNPYLKKKKWAWLCSNKI